MKKANLLSFYGLEVIITDHCNLSCKGCSQNSPYMIESYYAPTNIIYDLKKLSSILRVKKIKFLGGEPLLHPEIDRLLSTAVAIDIADIVAVKSNGLLIDKMTEIFWSSIDYLTISSYPNTRMRLKHLKPFIISTCKSFNVELQWLDVDTFQVITGKNKYSVQFTKNTFSTCEYKNYTHALHRSRLYRCSPSINLPRYLEAHGSKKILCDSGISLNSTNDISTKVLNYLNSPHFLPACQYCLGSTGNSFPHKQELVSPSIKN